jgi:hypothetical protein
MGFSHSLNHPLQAILLAMPTILIAIACPNLATRSKKNMKLVAWSIYALLTSLQLVNTLFYECLNVHTTFALAMASKLSTWILA